jgi:hypothetical protein
MKKSIYITLAILALISSLWVSIKNIILNNFIPIIRAGAPLFRIEFIGYYLLLLLPIIPIISFFKKNKIFLILNILVLIVSIPLIIIEILSGLQEQQLF